MATVVWEVVKQIWCECAGKETDLLEERIYPERILPAAAAAYRVRARRCAHDLECNLAGYHCRWAWSQPDRDPFAEAEELRRSEDSDQA